MTDWLTEAFEQAERDWAALPVCARPVYVPASGGNRMADYVVDLTGNWTPALAADYLYRALRDARNGKTTLITSDGEDVAVMGPAEPPA